MDTKIANKSANFGLYNVLWYMRWVIQLVFSLIFPSSPITLYLAWSILSAGFAGLSILSIKDFKGCATILVPLEETLVFLYNLAMFFLFWNRRKDYDMLSQFWFKFWCFIAVFALVFSLSAGFVLGVVAIFDTDYGVEEEKVQTKDFEIAGTQLSKSGGIETLNQKVMKLKSTIPTKFEFIKIDTNEEEMNKL